ncbi:MAG: LanC-like protein [Gaiellaceae bacterium]
MPLYQPEDFEPLTDEPWDEGRVRQAIAEIVAEADAAFDPHGLWPAAEWDSWRTPVPLTVLYVGAAGVVWALRELEQRGHARSGIDLSAAALRTLETWRAEPGFMREIELPDPAEAGFLAGESGILLVAWLLAQDAALADDLHVRVLANRDNAADEVMWGAPGTMLAARVMLEHTGEDRWAEAWQDSADALRARRDPDGLWTYRLYGGTYRGLGPAHGLVGNTAALLQGGRDETLERETAAVLADRAVLEDGAANWPNADGEFRVQWCAGAPGIVTTTGAYLDEVLVVAGAELSRRTGPAGMEKGSGICHGTASQGYGFLAAFERTGDEAWLADARSFAVHALDQVKRRGHGRYSLWTGDVGVALYAGDCLDARLRYPFLP